MIQGFWIVLFPDIEARGGVMLFLDGQVLGGDNGYTYVGTYEGNGSNYTATARANNFNPAFKSITGQSGDHILNLVLAVHEDVITGIAHPPSAPSLSVRLRFTRRVTLSLAIR